MNEQGRATSNRTMTFPPKIPRVTWSRCLQSAVALFVTWCALGLSPVHALDVGSRAPEIGLRDLDGRPVRLRSLRGKVVLVDFWASWCEPCKEELPVLNRLYERYRDRGLVIVGVSVDRNLRNARSFLRRTPVTFPVVHDGEHQVAGRYEPPRMPSSYLIDRRGVIRRVHEGFRRGDAAKLEKAIKRALKKKRQRRRSRRGRRR